jgi:uroporphyrinogen III methyltransferase/synthase
MRKKDARDLAGVRICAIGPATRERVEDFGLRVDYTPRKFVAESIIRGFKRMGPLNEKKILLPRARVAREVLPEELKRAGAKVTEIAVYETRMGKLDAGDMVSGISEIDMITFTSSSTATNFRKAVGLRDFRKIVKKIKAASIGPVTTGTLREMGIDPVVQAGEYTIPGLIRAIEAYFGQSGD